MPVPSLTLRTGARIPVIGYGTFKLGQDIAQRCVEQAIEAGYTSIDTASAYRNEEQIGDAIAHYDRETLFVTTKLWNNEHGYDPALRALDRSLKWLKTDYVDLYLIHWPGPDSNADTWKALERLHREGRARAIGVSNFFREHLEALIQTAEIRPMSDQLEMHPYMYDKALADFVQSEGMVFEAWGPLQRGRGLFDDPLMAELATKYDCSAATIVLAWGLSKGVRVLPKSVDPSRMRANLDAAQMKLDEADLLRIDALNRHERVGPHPDSFFPMD